MGEICLGWWRERRGELRGRVGQVMGCARPLIRGGSPDLRDPPFNGRRKKGGGWDGEFGKKKKLREDKGHGLVDVSSDHIILPRTSLIHSGVFDGPPFSLYSVLISLARDVRLVRLVCASPSASRSRVLAFFALFVACQSDRWPGPLPDPRRRMLADGREERESTCASCRFSRLRLAKFVGLLVGAPFGLLWRIPFAVGVGQKRMGRSSSVSQRWILGFAKVGRK
ncbi:hypothetical protein B0J12DRAFT_682017 [Macrophomina phaseolina]|uniref:Uncharacterized protein n=1 Tax=Macrophomina phaseolina TaxID=35725 RepID=A0ABQ8FVT6_9PEZI|nr:hypothetical protein B0J12DRAFT_682017 [Macrophomina phaseolina]